MRPAFHDIDTKIRKLRRWQLIFDTFGGVLGGTTVAAALTEGYYYYYQAKTEEELATPGPKGNTYVIVMGKPDESTLLSLLRVYILVASIFLAAVIIVRYVLDKKIRVYDFKKHQLEWQKVRFEWILCIIECIYALVCLPPKVNGVYKDSDSGIYVTTDMLITTLMLGRIYLLWRMLYQYSAYHGDKAEAICDNTNCSVSPWFVFKCELKERPFILVGLLLVILFFVMGFGIRQCEVPYEFISGFNWDFIMNGVWNTFLTVTTVGYGDIFPSTQLGRLICVAVAMVGAFFTSLLVIAISNYFTMSMKERNAVYRLKRRLAMMKFRHEAQIFISWAWRYAFYVRPMRIYSKKSANQIHYKLCTSYAQFKQHRTKLWHDSEYAISEMDRGYFAVSDALNRNQMKCQMIMWDVRVFNEHLKLLEKRQLQIEKMVDVLHSMYSRIDDVTKSYLVSAGARMNLVNFSDFGSLLRVDSRSFAQDIQSIADEVPYKYLSSQLITAFRFRTQGSGAITLSRAEPITSGSGARRSAIKHSSRVLNRLELVANQSNDTENDKKEMIRSGSVMNMLKALFGKEKAKLLYQEMRQQDSKSFSRVTLNLTDALKLMSEKAEKQQQDDVTGSYSSRSGTPRTNRTQESLLRTNRDSSRSPTRTQIKKESLVKN